MKIEYFLVPGKGRKKLSIEGVIGAPGYDVSS